MNLGNIKKKLSYYNIKHKIRRIFNTAGENDFYPQFIKSKYSILSNSSRFDFWNKLAKKHKPFKYFYVNNPEKYFDDSPPIDKENKYYSALREFYKNGISQIENFFDEDEHEMIIKFFEENTIKFLDNEPIKQVICKEENLNKMIHNKIKFFEKMLFGQIFKTQHYSFISILKKSSEISQFGTSSLFHSDRFIPSIKLIYYPTKVEVDPFEYALGSHIINQKFKKNILIDLAYEEEFSDLILKKIKLNREKGEKIDKDLLQKISNTQFKKDLSNFEFKKYYSKANTLLLVATHGCHRRCQTRDLDKNGIRNNITVSYYNEFTRHDLLKKIFN